MSKFKENWIESTKLQKTVTIVGFVFAPLYLVMISLYLFDVFSFGQAICKGLMGIFWALYSLVWFEKKSNLWGAAFLGLALASFILSVVNFCALLG